jgi:tetratricopeptide (TPR) repeat protein
LLANSLPVREAPEEIFAALERALELIPRCEEAFDQRAFRLTQLNRFEEALAQCAPPVFASTPVKLRVRAAWIEAQRGNLPRAVALANEALTEHPEHYGGWQLLSEWCLQLQRGDEAVQAAEKMAALAPMEPVPLGYLGDLKLRFGDSPGAKAAFHRAFALDPDYEYAGFQLFQVQLADKEFDAAARTLAVLSRRSADHRARACSIRLATARGDLERAQSLFRELCDDGQATDFSFDAAINALENRLSRKAVDRLVEQRLSQPGPPPALAEVWVERQTSRNCWRLHSRLAALRAEADTGRRAVIRYLDQLGKAYQRAREKQDILLPARLRFHFRRLMRRHSGWLRQDVQGWGKVGYVLAVMGRPRPVVEWLADWRERPDAESWMLNNLIVMLHRLKRHDEAFEVIRHAVALRHGDDLFEVFSVWAAFEEAVRGNLAKAQQHLAALPTESVNEHRRPAQLMTQLLIELKRAAIKERSTLFKTARATLRSAFSGRRPFNAEPYAREAYLRLMREVAPDLGGLGPRLWGRWFYRGGDWLWLPVLMLLAPVAIGMPPFLVLWWVLFRRFRGR